MHRPPKNPLPLSLLQIRDRLSGTQRDVLSSTWVGLPLVVSSPIQVSFQPQLTAWRGKLLSQGDCGVPVHAASFIRARTIVLEKELLSNFSLLRFIFVHELFHFVWARLGNTRRSEYGRILLNEIQRRARGELGESSEVKKAEVRRLPTPSSRPKLWREYVCESFCDSAASLLCGGCVHTGLSLAGSRIAIRRQWLMDEGGETRRWAV